MQLCKFVDKKCAVIRAAGAHRQVQRFYTGEERMIIK